MHAIPVQAITEEDPTTDAVLGMGLTPNMTEYKP